MFKQEREAAMTISDAANARIKPSQFAMSFPALNGEHVLQGHADYCAANGHATHTTLDAEGEATIAERCPRCGTLTATPARRKKDTMSNAPETPAHLAPAACYVCGSTEDRHTGAGHGFWTNAQAAKDFAREPQADGGAESRYVDQHRPY